MWHMLGAFVVIICFAATFGFDPWDPSTMASFLYLIIAASLWNMGWAAVQVSTRAKGDCDRLCYVGHHIMILITG